MDSDLMQIDNFRCAWRRPRLRDRVANDLATRIGQAHIAAGMVKAILLVV